MIAIYGPSQLESDKQSQWVMADSLHDLTTAVIRLTMAKDHKLGSAYLTTASLSSVNSGPNCGC